jgi:hypothetical protein
MLQDDLYIQVLLEVNKDIEYGNENAANRRNHEDSEEEFVIKENLDVDRDRIEEKQLTVNEFEADEDEQ